MRFFKVGDRTIKQVAANLALTETALRETVVDIHPASASPSLPLVLVADVDLPGKAVRFASRRAEGHTRVADHEALGNVGVNGPKRCRSSEPMHADTG